MCHRKSGPGTKQAAGVSPISTGRSRGRRTTRTCRSASIRCSFIRSARPRSEEHTSELQSLKRNSYAVFCFKKTKEQNHKPHPLARQTTSTKQEEPPL